MRWAWLAFNPGKDLLRYVSAHPASPPTKYHWSDEEEPLEDYKPTGYHPMVLGSRYVSSESSDGAFTLWCGWFKTRGILCGILKRTFLVTPPFGFSLSN